ncbi:MAG: 6-pyruvoyl tetrahydrobiopterin synthase [Phenylobacterium sp. RIFCSPHIGHO2_01_FULL_69_31]|jgi:6-pyruvoyltetrahydropterin/6-carboxytetrahydropterin synthase|uniref:6-pyruvoyl trahydropterin synthase family protein n=1 Tax=Phenylobacterium sp. RIFCSPHIGHO2_01_FULL_69_31 TaxID=1801944 RepID=UPI0008B6D86D|nr:6-carboxytetrahydropterin synthase [Phenylobacterium sp. RIFCSPHIGHO2_01_FULL_69_31]OHB31995.1 MAG: 6-pyruvoyl tetrahydrobiopterin synthase [Phenylobacterium sp. RIFCSPHIGHO2_01_FULL_69_31]
MAFFSTKTYGADRGLSCALRQWAADSQCQLLHGYSLGFRFTFAAEQLDHRGWVVDFGAGGFGPIRSWLHETFDHALLVARDDPDRAELLRLAELGLANVRLLPATSCERIAQYVFETAQPMIAAQTKGRCWIDAVECFEHGANSAVYRNPESVRRQVSAEVLQALADEAT